MLSKSRGRDRSLPLSLCLSVAEIYVSLMEKLKWIKSIIVSIAPRWPLAFDFYSLFVSVISPFWFLCFITSFLSILSQPRHVQSPLCISPSVSLIMSAAIHPTARLFRVSLRLSLSLARRPLLTSSPPLQPSSRGEASLPSQTAWLPKPWVL